MYELYVMDSRIMWLQVHFPYAVLLLLLLL